MGCLSFTLVSLTTLSVEELIDATSPPPACLQKLYDPLPFLLPQQRLSEDCLFLNIYTAHSWIEEGSSRPVVVYLHGGSFSNGDGVSRDPGGLVEQGGLVFVSLNYRWVWVFNC